jgi:hypothetical protein
MRLRLTGLALLLCACASPPGAEPTTASLRGSFQLDANAAPGDAFVFLYNQSDPPLPRGSGRPASLSAVPLPRGFQSSPPNGDYTFAAVEPGQYLVRGIIDARGLFDPYVDVLAQPFAGDADLGPVSLSLNAGEAKRLDLASPRATDWDPPMFTVDAPASGAVTLAANTRSFTLMHLRVAPLPFAQADRVAFLYGPADADHDGKLDDLTGSGQPTPYPEVVLQRIPQRDDGPAFLDVAGNPLNIVLPATVSPDPAGRNETQGTTQIVNGLYVAISPTALVQLPPDVTGMPRTRRLPAIPTGEYAITVVQGTAQYWQVPNGLGPGGPFAANHGGPFTSQVARIHVVPAR